MTSEKQQKHFVHGLAALGITLVLILLVSGCTQQSGSPPVTTPPAATQTTIGMPNPASVYCVNAGGTLDIKKDNSGNEYGMCTFKNGTSCDEWALFRNEGCKPAPIPTSTGTEGKKMFTFTGSDNKGSGDITKNTQFAVVLAENPTTGFMWNATVSDGLEIQSSEYIQGDTAPGLVGVGGNRTWVIVAKDLGDQQFSAIYHRPWENITGNETNYTVTIHVVQA